jgi:hypothetical protein
MDHTVGCRPDLRDKYELSIAVDQLQDYNSLVMLLIDVRALAWFDQDRTVIHTLPVAGDLDNTNLHMISRISSPPSK